MNTTTKVAVIGLGNIGTAVASNLVKGNHAVIVADRTIAKANALAQQLGSLAQAMDIPSAIKEADVIVLAIWFNGIKEVLQQYATELEGKIIVDPSNPIAPDENGGFKKIIGEQESAGEIIASLLPKNAKLAKALGTLGVASLTNAAFQQPLNVLFYATEDCSITEVVEQLIRDNGFEPVRIGGFDQSIRIEVFGDLHEFGSLGKTVTKAEVKELAESVI
ncbi:NADPH-dependent F420 reductase [Lacibacter sediminis]|uniref:NAD(P)-binding domain-containing protein n=1 Tax=Lacibacter sediminis TaxID=2760713 RepID=A0A7G5XH23_9BACT|nr:NAD(P)-binding domain-containing protein [Lacibacter sediminis]QNA44776.1 NAD(P)-binding domain-containing protein [Lacibacter sediminis]